MKNIASFDIDGVLFMGADIPGVSIGRDDIIISGRSFEEADETFAMLLQKGISYKTTMIYLNPLDFTSKSRYTSGLHKAIIIMRHNRRFPSRQIAVHYEDDPVQAAVIRREVPKIHVVLLQHELITKENVRHTKF